MQGRRLTASLVGLRTVRGRAMMIARFFRMGLSLALFIARVGVVHGDLWPLPCKSHSHFEFRIYQTSETAVFVTVTVVTVTAISCDRDSNILTGCRGRRSSASGDVAVCQHPACAYARVSIQASLRMQVTCLWRGHCSGGAVVKTPCGLHRHAQHAPFCRGDRQVPYTRVSIPASMRVQLTCLVGCWGGANAVV